MRDRRLRCLMTVMTLGLLCCVARPAGADEPEPPATKDWHAGLNLRTDFATHPLRLDGGIRIKRYDFIVALDPTFFLDGQHDLDVLVAPTLTPGWAGLVGWRATSIGIAGGTQWQHKSLVGLMAQAPSFAGEHLRAHFGLELAILWVKHGAGLPTETFSLSSPRHYLDLFNFGLFARFEYVSSPF